MRIEIITKLRARGKRYPWYIVTIPAKVVKTTPLRNYVGKEVKVVIEVPEHD